ncbi:MAG: 3-hydroxyacyl-[acyl-carrier-protein] dehydratase FabZ [Lentisphaerae bacterium RIFOXYA12_FULL_48_11]|nr:MAG: 3-hydroxyacyl-[acyl-carrier-protein] dehydratase FabZ [Lentisphaerae bacterium RIFOXYA12_FULL_48_11]
MSTLSIDDIMKLLPHRYPMLLVDRIIECDDKKKIIGLKNVTVNEPFFQGHFPGVPVMPGVLQIEAMAQVGGILLNRVANIAGQIPYFMAIDKAKFRKVVKPGDQLRIEVEIINLRSRAVRLAGKVLVDGSLASEAELLCMMTDQKAGS